MYAPSRSAAVMVVAVPMASADPTVIDLPKADDETGTSHAKVIVRAKVNLDAMANADRTRVLKLDRDAMANASPMARVRDVRRTCRDSLNCSIKITTDASAAKNLMACVMSSKNST